MITTGTSPRRLENVSTKDLENVLWKALDMDDFSDEMVYGSFVEGQPIALGTGHTVNACYGCSNSASTAGCGTCR